MSLPSKILRITLSCLIKVRTNGSKKSQQFLFIDSMIKVKVSQLVSNINSNFLPMQGKTIEMNKYTSHLCKETFSRKSFYT